MSEIKVGFGALEATRADLMSSAGRLQGQLDDLKRFVAPLVAGWQGAAAAGYALRQREWDTAAAELQRILTEVGMALGRANDGYREVERRNAGRWA